jgi:hypothetical protein
LCQQLFYYTKTTFQYCPLKNFFHPCIDFESHVPAADKREGEKETEIWREIDERERERERGDIEIRLKG